MTSASRKFWLQSFPEHSAPVHLMVEHLKNPFVYWLRMWLRWQNVCITFKRSFPSTKPGVAVPSHNTPSPKMTLEPSSLSLSEGLFGLTVCVLSVCALLPCAISLNTRCRRQLSWTGEKLPFPDRKTVGSHANQTNPVTVALSLPCGSTLRMLSVHWSQRCWSCLPLQRLLCRQRCTKHG